MKTVYLLRHADAERGKAGSVTKQGEERAGKLSKTLPRFAKVISSDTSRTKLTALLATGVDSVSDARAGFCELPLAKGSEILQLAADKGITFLEATVIYDDPGVTKAIDDKAQELNQLVDETLAGLRENESALIISHDMTIVPAMALRGEPRESIGYLSGYTITDGGTVAKYEARV